MSLVHGRDITAEEIERIIGREFSIQRFVSLCNALIWATAKPLGLAQTRFTERVFVRDSGVDAEWVLDVQPAEGERLHFIVPGRNVFQYKQRDVTARDRNRLFGDLRRDLQRAASEVALRTESALQQYVLFTNVHLSIDQGNELAHAIRTDYHGELSVQIFGAAEIAASLNNLPHVRSSFFATAQFAAWHRAWESHGRTCVKGTALALVGRLSVVDSVRSAIDDESVSAVLIAGASDIGKSRVALASTDHRQVDTVFALDPVSLRIADLLALKSPHQRIVVVIDDPDFDRVEELVSTALGENLKLVLTIPSSRAADLVNYGRDPRVKLFNIEALSETESDQLLRASGAKFDYSVQSWVIDQAGGNPGILLGASAIGQQLRIEGPAFRDQVGSALENRARVLVGDSGIEILRSLSVMTAVGFRRDAELELEALCGALGNVTANEVITQATALSQTGLLRLRGNYLEVVPPILANYFAESALAGRPRELAQLFRELSPTSRVRLLGRIRQLKIETLETFWNELFERGSLSTFEGAMADILHLRLVAPAVPNRVAPLLLRGLRTQSVQERAAISGTVRRELVWTLDQLLFRNISSAAALRSLSLLAEAENERWANSSTGIFAECFHPLHPQMPLPLADRLAILQELVALPTTPQRQKLAIKAVDAAFERYGSITLRRSDGPEPFDSTPGLTYEQLHRYSRELIGILRNLIDVGDQEVASTAGKAFVSAVGTFAVTAQPDEGVRILEEIQPRILEEASPIKLEQFVQAVQFTIQGLEAQRDRFGQEADRAIRLLAIIEHGHFEVRIKRWIGTWETGGLEQDNEGQPEIRSDREIRELAREVIMNPKILTEQLLVWLLPTEAKRSSEFFFWLGRQDRDAHWQRRIEDLGRSENGHIAFSSYFGGRVALDQQVIEGRLDELSVAGQVRAEAIVSATRFIPGNLNSVRRITRLLGEGRLEASFAQKQLMVGGWMNSLTGEEACELLNTIAGVRLEHAFLVIDFLSMWVHSDMPIDGDLRELAWRALESAPQSGEAWDFDLVANALAPDDLDRAFALLEHLLTLPDGHKSWEPLDRQGGNRFWNTLWASDRERCLRTVFAAAGRSPLAMQKLSWHLTNILNQDDDRDLLIEFGQQSIESATFVTSILTAARPGFWPIAIALISSFPESDRIRANVAAGAEHMGHVISGSWSAHLDKCAEDVEQAIEGDRVNGRVHEFMADLARRLRQAAEVHRQHEADREVNL